MPRHPPSNAIIKKEIYIYLQNNHAEALKIIKAIKKRDNNELSLDIDATTPVAMTDNVVVDLSGCRPAYKQGCEESDQDLFRRPPKKRRRTDAPAPATDPAPIFSSSPERPERDATPHPQSPSSAASSVASSPVRTVDRTVALPKLSDHLKNIVINIYSAIGDIDTTSPFPHVAILPLEEEEFTFDPTVMVGNAAPMETFKRLCHLAVKTELGMDQSFALRCYNSFKMEREWIAFLSEKHPNSSSYQISYSLKQRYIEFCLETDGMYLGSTDHDQLKHALDVEWDRLKRCTKRGKVLVEFMEALDLGTAGILLSFSFDYILTDS